MSCSARARPERYALTPQPSNLGRSTLFACDPTEDRTNLGPDPRFDPNGDGDSTSVGGHQHEAPWENLLGVRISAVNPDHAVRIIRRLLRERNSTYLCVAAAHSLMDCRRDPELRRIFNEAALVAPDGMPLVWWLQLKGHGHVRRVYAPDLVEATIKGLVDRGTRHYFYGGAAGVAERMVEKLQRQHPRMVVAGFQAPPFSEPFPREDEASVARINATSPDIVWVGLGTGKQEPWIVEHMGKIQAPLMIGVGAAFDFVSGAKPQAPRWMQQSGLEWVFRLLSEPMRLWPRYSEYPLFVLLALSQLLGLKRFECSAREETDGKRR